MDDRLPPPPPQDDPSKIADASALFRDDPAEPSRPAQTAPAASDGGYDFAPVEPTTPKSSPTPSSSPASSPSARPKKAAAPRPSREPHEAVPEVWSRSAEWGKSLAVVIGSAMASGFVVFVLLAFERYGLAFLVLLAGGLVTVLLTYPILITLERPTRITPEQGARDFFVALSHHFPHHRRMWLLLSQNGRVCGSYASPEGFTNYWKGVVADLKKAKGVSGFTPLKFKVEDFRSEKSAGKSEVDASYTVVVSVRGKTDAGPIATYPVKTTLVKGPDNMWYLDRGTLP